MTKKKTVKKVEDYKIKVSGDLYVIGTEEFVGDGMCISQDSWDNIDDAIIEAKGEYMEPSHEYREQAIIYKLVPVKSLSYGFKAEDIK